MKAHEPSAGPRPAQPGSPAADGMHPGEPGATGPGRHSRRQAARVLAAGLLAATGAGTLLGGCASLPGMEPPRVSVVGVERLRGEGLEWRLALKLRVQNMGSVALSFDGLAVDLDVNGRRLASGVLSEAGTIARYGEVVLTVPVSVSATAAVRQMLGLMDGSAPRELPYVLRGRISGGPVAGMTLLGGSVSFTAEGSLLLPR
ncbi:MAG: LEA type 2 family protein [Rubrivivax sp.]